MSGKILIVDDLVTNRIILKVKLTAASHGVMQAATGEDALRIARDEQPRLILLDMFLPDLSGIEVCRRLRADPATRHTPIILISASTERASRLEALAAGADEFLTKPLNETVLMARIRNLLHTSQNDADLRERAETCRAFGLAEAPAGFAGQPRIGLVAGDRRQALVWRAALAEYLPARYLPLAAGEALSSTDGPEAPDLYVIAADLERPGDGLRLIADLRARDDGRRAGLFLCTEDPGHETAALALDLGAHDLVPLPLDPQETALRLRMQLARQRHTESLRKAVSQGLQMAAIDPLTGLYNRRYALAHLDRIAGNAARAGTSFAVMVLDIDHFKLVNDRYGHPAGDAVLETVAARLSAVLQRSELLARIGGEEFLVVQPDTTLDRARTLAEKLCQAVAESPIALPGDLGLVTITLSAGLSLDRPREIPAEAGCRDTETRARSGATTETELPGGMGAAMQAGGSTDSAAGAPQQPRSARRFAEPAVSNAATPPNARAVFAPAHMGSIDPAGSVRHHFPGAARDPGLARALDTVQTTAPALKTAERPNHGAAPEQEENPSQDTRHLLEEAATGAVRNALARADAALLAAKSEGRNQVTISTAA